MRSNKIVGCLCLLVLACDASPPSAEPRLSDASDIGAPVPGAEMPQEAAPAPDLEPWPFDPNGIDDHSLLLGPTGTVYPASGDTRNEWAGQQNSGFGIDTTTPEGSLLRKLFVTFSHHDDVPSAPQTDAVMQSTDGASSFHGYVRGVMSAPSFALRLRDGRLMSFGFVPIGRTDSASGSILTLDARVSSDEGVTWKVAPSRVALPKMSGTTDSRGRLSGHPIQLADGTVLLEWYGQFAGDAGAYRAELLASADLGRTFVRRGTIAAPPTGKSYPEPDVEQLTDGSLYAVFRQHVGSTLAPLLWSRSTNAGASWSAPTEVRITFGSRPAAVRTGVAPRLLLMPNGILVLSSGRPDNFVAMSSDRARVAWTQAKVTYVNYPASTTGPWGPAVLRYRGSSGNTGLAALDSNRLVQFGDNCANGWGCPPEDSQHTIDNKNRVWRRFIEVLTPDVGKIDLLSKFQQGLVAVTTDMTWSSSAHPRARPEGAFDGSTEYWSSAVKAGGGGSFTVKLDGRHDLTRVGLSIRHGSLASASVYASMDGVDWGPAAIAVADHRTHHALEYFALPAPVPALYVKVLVENHAPCDTELGGACALLNELELYSSTDSFENDPMAGTPRGYTNVAGALVSLSSGGRSRRALSFVDNSDVETARATWVGTPAPRKTFRFSLKPVALPSAFLFGIRGKDASGAAVDAYHLGVLSDGSVARYNPAISKWEALAPPKTVPMGVFSEFSVDADLERATVGLNGQVVATVPPSVVGATVLDAHSFSSGGSKPKGDQFWIDDVFFH
jgi:hypothetical protein